MSALGGLIVDARYRGLPEKRGKQISLIRFVFLGMFPDSFSSTILSELMPLLNSDGSSPFWSAIGEKYTGYDYNDAMDARIKGHSFIKEFFPSEDIVLDPSQQKLHRNLTSVFNTGRAQQHMITKQGFTYKHKVDAMDAGLQYTIKKEDIGILKKGAYYCCEAVSDPSALNRSALVGVVKDGRFYGGHFQVGISQNIVLFSHSMLPKLHLESGDKVYVSLL